MYYGESQETRTNVAISEDKTTVLRVRFKAHVWEGCFLGGLAVMNYDSPEWLQSVELRGALPRSISPLPVSSSQEARVFDLPLGKVLTPFFTRAATRHNVGGSPMVTSAERALTVEPIWGTNQYETTMESVVGGRQAIGVRHAGPLRLDKAWFAFASRPHWDGDTLSVPVALSSAFAPTPEHKGEVFVSAKLDSDDGLAAGRWESSFHNGRTILKASIGTAWGDKEQSHDFWSARNVSPTSVRTSATRLAIRRHSHLVGLHELGASIEGSMSREAVERDRRVAMAVADTWRVRPNIRLDLGTRFEVQRGRHWLPRAGVVYDHSEEGRSRLFAHWGRYLDEDGVAESVLMSGLEVEFIEDLSIGLAATHRRRAEGHGLGALASIKYLRDRRRSEVHVRVDPSGGDALAVDASLQRAVFNSSGGSLWFGMLIREGGEGHLRGSGGSVRFEAAKSQYSIGIEGTRNSETGPSAAVSLEINM